MSDPDDWDREAHEDLLALLGHPYDAAAEAAGPPAGDSFRLVLHREHFDDAGVNHALEDDDLAATVARLRRAIAGEQEALLALRRELVEAADVGADAEPEAEAATFTGVTPGLMLLHRYEMAHERSLRAAIKDLAALEKARPAGDCETQVLVNKEFNDKKPASPVGPEAGESAAPSEPGPGVVLGGSGGPRGGRPGLPGPRRQRRRPRTAR